MWLVSVVIKRYIDILIIIINFPYSTCIRSFFGSNILTSLFILKMFFQSCRDVSDDACDVACDNLVIQHYRFTSSLHPTCNVIFVR